MASRKRPLNELVFRIDAFTPDTLPMARLAVYLADLAVLYGEPAAVHFVAVGNGSAKLKKKVDASALEAVRNRLDAIQRHAASDDVMAAYVRVDRLLADDGAVGYVALGGKKVVVFEGRKKAQESVIGPVIQTDSLDGELIRVGGKDATVPVHLREGDGAIYRCTANVALAKDLGQYLYQQVRLVGTAHWYRRGDGDWTLEFFRVDNFSVLNDAALPQAIERIREVDAEWSDDAMSEIATMRSSEDDE